MVGVGGGEDPDFASASFILGASCLGRWLAGRKGHSSSLEGVGGVLVRELQGR